MSDYKSEFLSQLSTANSHVNYEGWLENQLTQTKKESRVSPGYNFQILLYLHTVAVLTPTVSAASM